MRREIGSEFWRSPLIESDNDLFPTCTQWYLSGRSALKAIIAELVGVKTISLPSWCCDSMIKPFADVGIEVRFYPVYWQKGLFKEIELGSDALLIMDYFGYTTPIPGLCNYDGIVIRDVTHSIISATYSDADYYFGSLRKWCGVWTGGYAWTKDEHTLEMGEADKSAYVSLRSQAMKMKRQYIEEGLGDKEYLKTFDDAEDCLESVDIAPAADRDVELMKRLDVEMIKSNRRKNAEVLRVAFSDWLIFPTLSSTDTPMYVPVLVPDGKRDALRSHLINNEIYCPVHWPTSDYHKLTEQEKYIYDNELSLVCDQRYTEEDMMRIVETIKSFIEEK
ncbi:MAG: hypothetical protein IJJ01_09960 [Firmicutes bacterium]|nr:hypothetical protein [Bacillota bacterium]